jgi:hypothetical protein
LLLSELGAFLATPTHAPAGTKRLAKLVHSPQWHASAIDAFLLDQGQAVVAAAPPGERVLCILDGSVLEKPESATVEGLRPVRSSKARRVTRPRPKLGKGYYCGKPTGPYLVPGYQWLAALLAPWHPPTDRLPVAVAAWYWYGHPPKPEVVPDAATEPDLAPPTPATPVGPPPPPDPLALPLQSDREAEQAVLDAVTTRYGTERLFHVWDRGFSGAPWLGAALDARWHFVVRWKKGNRLRPASAPSVDNPAATAEDQDRDGVAAWRLTQRGRIWGERQIANPRRPDEPLTMGFKAFPVRLLHRDEPLWLIHVRLGHGATTRRPVREPWRLLTTEPVATVEQCWAIVLAYVARWQIEQTLRVGKAELGIESIRVRAWQTRAKLLALATLVYAVLLELLGNSTGALVHTVLRWAHRTGRQATAWRPLYRFRQALAHLWNQYHPTLAASP